MSTRVERRTSHAPVGAGQTIELDWCSQEVTRWIGLRVQPAERLELVRFAVGQELCGPVSGPMAGMVANACFGEPSFGAIAIVPVATRMRVEVRNVSDEPCMVAVDFVVATATEGEQLALARTDESEQLEPEQPTDEQLEPAL